MVGLLLFFFFEAQKVTPFIVLVIVENRVGDLSTISPYKYFQEIYK